MSEGQVWGNFWDVVGVKVSSSEIGFLLEGCEDVNGIRCLERLKFFVMSSVYEKIVYFCLIKSTDEDQRCGSVTCMKSKSKLEIYIAL